MPYTPGGKAQRVLERLEQGPATLGQLRAHVMTRHARKLWFVIVTMRREGLITCDDGVFAILPAGDEELDFLRSQVGGRPNVRIFSSNQGAGGANNPAHEVA